VALRLSDIACVEGRAVAVAVHGGAITREARRLCLARPIARLGRWIISQRAPWITAARTWGTLHRGAS